jgi:hypothetical protein
MNWVLMAWDVGAVFGLLIVVRMAWDIFCWMRQVRMLRRQVRHEREMAILMNGKDLEHFLFENGWGPDPDAAPEPPPKSARGLQSVELD